MKKRIIVISGPTSVGKSDIAISVAQRIGGEIVSADSMQVYKGMDIGTGKMKTDEMQGIRHHLIDVMDPRDDFNVSKFRDMATVAIEDIVSRGKIPIIVGGTGFYIKSLLCTGAVGDPGKDSEFKEQLRARADNEGVSILRDELLGIDPVYAERITKNDRSRIIRALEYCHTTGVLYSDYCDSSESNEPKYDAKLFVLECDREILYRKMDERIDKMMEKGLVDEVERLLEGGVDRNCTSMNGIGYKEIASFLSGEIPLDEAVRQIKSNTHHYAVRQSTWFRKQKGSIVVDASDKDEAIKKILISISSSCV